MSKYSKKELEELFNHFFQCREYDCQICNKEKESMCCKYCGHNIDRTQYIVPNTLPFNDKEYITTYYSRLHCPRPPNKNLEERVKELELIVKDLQLHNMMFGGY